MISVEKIYNSYAHNRVYEELNRLCKKHSSKDRLSLMKHLFHGTGYVAPKVIYSNEDGLDMRYSSNGLNGYGIYFADNSQYSSIGYSFKPD